MQFYVKVAASGRDTTPHLNVVDYQTSLVRTGCSPIIMLEQTGSVHGSRGVCKMAATTCSVVSHPDRVTLIFGSSIGHYSAN